MEISYEEVDLLIRKIALGQGLIYLDNSFLSIYYPNNILKIKSKQLRDFSYNSAIKDGLLPKEHLEKLILSRGIFSETDEATVERINSKISAQEILLAKTLKVRANQDRIKKTISELQNELSTLLVKKYSKLYMSADNKADEDMYGYMCSECVFNDKGERYWPTHKDFLDYRDIPSKNMIFSSFMDLMKGMDTTTIRYIARSNLWRIRYTTSLKTSEPLFGVPLVDYTSDQLSLIYWSNYYEQIYSMLTSDRPSESVIEDDEELDKFMTEYYKEMNNESSIRRDQKNKNKFNLGLSALDSDEVIITQSNSLYLDIDYDKPREAQKIKDKTDIKKKAIPNKAAYISNKKLGG